MSITAHLSLVSAATGDALAYFASLDACERAAKSLEAGEFSAWSADVQREAALEVRALMASYHDTETY